MARVIIDSVVVDRKNINPTLYYNAISLPTYMGAVQDATKPYMRLDANIKDKAAKIGVVEALKNMVASFQLEPGPAKIILCKDDMPITYEVSPALVKLIKVFAVGSYSQNVDYSICITKVVETILSNPDKVILPMPLPKDNKVQQVLSDELNEYLLSYFEENSIPYSKLLNDEKGVNKLMTAATALDV